MDQNTLGYFSVMLSFALTMIGIYGNTNSSDRNLTKHQSSISPKSKVINTEVEEAIKIGLLIPRPPEQDPLALAAKQGAELAVMIANRSGGYNGRSFKIVIRTADGIWGAGSKETVNFVYEDQVIAIITSLDGRNAHLTEQVAAKSHVVQLATRATDETLSQAFVPWFFRIVPSDKQQAEALLDEIYNKRNLHNINIFYEDDYDHKLAAETCKKIAAKSNIDIMGYTSFSSSEITPAINSINYTTQAIILFGSFKQAIPILEKIKEVRHEVQLFGPLSMTADGSIGSAYSDGVEGGIFVSSKFCFTTAGQEFKNIFIDTYNHIPNPAASYAYDGVNLIIESIKKAGLDR